MTVPVLLVFHLRLASAQRSGSNSAEPAGEVFESFLNLERSQKYE